MPAFNFRLNSLISVSDLIFPLFISVSHCAMEAC